MIVTTEAWDAAALAAGEFGPTPPYAWADSFTDVDGVALAAHHPEVGPGGYTDVVAGLIILNSRCAAAGSNISPLSSGDCGQSVITLNIEYRANTGDTGAMIRFRVLDSSNYAFIRLLAGNLDLGHVIGGALTVLNTVALPLVNGTTYVLAISVPTTTANVFVNGVQVLSGFISALLNHGTIFALNMFTGAGAPLSTFDSLLITYP